MSCGIHSENGADLSRGVKSISPLNVRYLEATMKSSPISILIYGRDSRLLETRKWVLESCGYRALTVMHLADIDRIPPSPPVSLLVLCQTLSVKERAAALAHATSRWPDIKKLALIQNGSRKSTAILRQVRHTLDGAARLVDTVRELVGYAASSTYSHTY